jgi:hypothetical protein
VEAAIGLVAHDKAIVAVVNDECLGNAFDCVIERVPGIAQLSFGQLAFADVIREQPVGFCELAFLRCQFDGCRARR